ncbi:hypothetical protein NKH77_41525 [Streptomyces sp. M19]
MSHAGDLVLFAFAGSPVGADVEKVQPASVVEQVSGSLHPGSAPSWPRCPRPRGPRPSRAAGPGRRRT